jgi:stage V sporulation protein D (sporulation-specific penicillin-binding protein)
MPKRKKQMQTHTSSANLRRNWRIVFSGLILCVLMGYLLYQVWHIQAIRGDELNQRSSEWRVNRVDHLSTITPARGAIFDRNMQPLATGHMVYNVALDITMLAYRENSAIQRGGANRREWMDETLTALHEELGIPMADLRALFVRESDNTWRPIIHDHWRIVAREIPANVAIPLRDNFRDVYIEEVSVRHYPDPFFAPQVLGFLRGDAQWGLEGRHHMALSGTAGRMFRAFDADNTLIRDEIPVRHGMNLVTTFDSDIQRLAQAMVDHTFLTIPCNAVAVIVMHPQTGEVFAMAQAPNFSLAAPDDPAFFTDPSIPANWHSMTEEEQINTWFYMWRNYHTTRSFEPGSIFKPIVIAAALEEGVISPHDVFFCNGAITIEGTEVICINRHAHGSVNVKDVLAVSCNVASIQIMQRLGADRFYQYRGYFGYGERTGIDLPGEDAVSSPAVMYTRSQLGPVQLSTSSIGQGFNTTTIQAAVSFASLINGGYVMRPFVVSHVIDANGAVVQENRPQIIRQAISRQTSDWIRHNLQYVIIDDRGTGRQTRIPGHTIGGKTGTSQQGALREDISLAYWIYTPVENPEFLIFAVIDTVHERERRAGGTLGPILRVFMEDLIVARNLPPSEGPYMEDWISPVIGQEPMPDFRGYRAVDVARILTNRDINFQVLGGGTVVSGHHPAPGRPMPQPNSVPVQLLTDPATYAEGSMTVMPNVTGLNASQALEFIRDAMLIPTWFGGTGELGEYDVYRQYPAAGTEVEQGMTTILRVRRRN